MRAVVPGDDERRGTAGQGEDGAEGGVQPVRVHEVGVGTGHAEGGDRGRVAAAGHVDVAGARR